MTSSKTFDTWEEAYEYADRLANGQSTSDHHRAIAVGNQLNGGFASGQTPFDYHDLHAAGEPDPDLIGHYGAILDLWEGIRMSINNQILAFTSYHGIGIEDPNVLQSAEFLSAIEHCEKGLSKVLEKSMALHSLGPWVKSVKGLGYKSVARVIAVTGDPYWNDKYDRPRKKAELREYCGWGDPGQRRQKGRKGNWNPRARTAVWNVADVMVQVRGVYRPIYDEARERYADALHDAHCPQCGGKKKPPMEPGTPIRPGHQHARGVRAVCKAFLDDLYDAAARLHELEAA